MGAEAFREVMIAVLAEILLDLSLLGVSSTVFDHFLVFVTFWAVPAHVAISIGCFLFGKRYQ